MKTHYFTSFGLLLFTFWLLATSCNDDSKNEPDLSVTTQDLYLTLNENPNKGYILGTVAAETNKGKLSFEITSQSPDGAISIDSISGDLSVNNELLFDYEENPKITAVITVSNELKSAISNVTVELLDVYEKNYAEIAGNNRKYDSKHVTFDIASNISIYLPSHLYSETSDYKIVLSGNFTGKEYTHELEPKDYQWKQGHRELHIANMDSVKLEVDYYSIRFYKSDQGSVDEIKLVILDENEDSERTARVVYSHLTSFFGTIKSIEDSTYNVVSQLKIGEQFYVRPDKYQKSSVYSQYYLVFYDQDLNFKTEIRSNGWSGSDEGIYLYRFDNVPYVVPGNYYVRFYVRSPVVKYTPFEPITVIK